MIGWKGLGAGQGLKRRAELWLSYRRPGSQWLDHGSFSVWDKWRSVVCGILGISQNKSWLRNHRV